MSGVAVHECRGGCRSGGLGQEWYNVRCTRLGRDAYLLYGVYSAVHTERLARWTLHLQRGQFMSPARKERDTRPSLHLFATQHVPLRNGRPTVGLHFPTLRPQQVHRATEVSGVSMLRGQNVSGPACWARRHRVRNCWRVGHHQLGCTDIPGFASHCRKKKAYQINPNEPRRTN